MQLTKAIYIIVQVFVDKIESFHWELIHASTGINTNQFMHVCTHISDYIYIFTVAYFRLMKVQFSIIAFSGISQIRK